MRRYPLPDLINSRCSAIGLLLLLTVSIMPGATQGQEQQLDGEPDFSHLEQQGLELKQSVLTYGENKRQQLVREAKAALASFDHRINELEAGISENSEQMSAAAERYAQQMVSTLERQRSKLGDWYESLRSDTDDSWDEVIFGFSRAYDEFYDSWENLEAQFGNELAY